ncbi:MAG TPA: endolytic transglycosylase MltG [Jatrophihabitans sp.]|nr:endolytic transglycosylase MltG [Jatrophihabitans sp.]
MRPRDQESLTDSDPHSLLFGPSDSDDDLYFEDEPARRLPKVQRVSRSELRAERGRRAARRRSRRFLLILGAALVAMLAVSTWLVVLPIYHYFHPADYSGSGSGTVIVEVKANDTAEDIGNTLYDKGVVASVRAFTNAAKDNSRSQSIAPGTYKLRSQMAAKSALALLLNPSSRVNSDVLVAPGFTTLDVLNRLTAKPCDETAKQSAVCGPGLDRGAVIKALENVKALGLPTDYTVDGKAPPSVEGFLYPATYYFPEKTRPSDALLEMITQFTEQVRGGFTAAASKNHVTPYEQLIIASIAQAEAKYPEDYGKVARVILNRLAAHQPLQVDATSAYPAKLKGLDPTSVIYNQEGGAYNTYQHVGLPPTPISNPGPDALDGAANPPKGNWMWYVNGDAQGHLFFTSSESQFEQAVQRCRAHDWGCA